MSNIKYVTLSAVCDYCSDRVSATSVTVNNYISTENMLPNKGGIEAADSVPELRTFSGYSAGDILLSNIRPYFQKIWFADRSGGCSNDVLVLRAKENTDAKFLYYVLSDNNFFNYDTVTSKGTKMPRGSKSAIMKYLVPDIDLPIQKRIADILSAYDDLIENNNRRIALLEKAARELYKEWFVRFRFPGYENAAFENGLPVGWKYIPFGQAVEIIDGDRGINYPKQEEFLQFGECLFLNAGNVTKSGFDFSVCQYITAEKDNSLRQGKLSYDDVVLTTRGTVGNVAFYNKKMTFSEMRINSGMVILRSIGIISPELIYTALREEYFQKMMFLYASGSAQPQLPIKDMKRIKILCCDKVTMDKFTKICIPIYEEISLFIMKNLNLARQRDLLLPRLMSGKLEV